MPHYRFDEIAFNITDKKMPEPGDEKMYIGLEHLDSGCLKVSRWGNEVELTGQKLVMKKGDILFGRRNTYLRRAAIAPHDGIFSAHGMIFRPKTEVVDPEYFPFFISSNYFMDAAIRISVGSLSPTVNWKTLKELEFDLPTLEEQRKNAAILKSINETKEAYQELLVQTDNLVKSQFIEMFGDPIDNPYAWPVMSLKAACEKLTDGTHFSPESFSKGDFKYITAKNIKVDGFDFSSLTYLPEDVHRPIFSRCNPEKGDILYIKDGATTGIAMINSLDEEFSLLSSVALLKYDRSLLTGEYLKELLNYPTFYENMRSNMGGAAITRLTVKKLCETMIMIAPIERQQQFAEFAEQSDKSKFCSPNRNLSRCLVIQQRTRMAGLSLR